QGFIVSIGAETEIDQRCSGRCMRLADLMHVVESLDNGREAKITMQIDQLHITRRALLPHDALHIGPMGIEIVRRINNENDHPLASHSSTTGGISPREGGWRAVRGNHKQ